MKVKRLIKGGPILAQEPTEIPIYLFDIVNNTRNSFDVDKIDYLQRDSYYTNVKISASYDRFLHYMHVNKYFPSMCCSNDDFYY